VIPHPSKVISHPSKINNKIIKRNFLFYRKPIKDQPLIEKAEMEALSRYANVHSSGFQRSNGEGEGKRECLLLCERKNKREGNVFSS